MFGVAQLHGQDDTSFKAVLCVPLKRRIKND